MQLSLGQYAPLVSLRRPLREFLEQSFPDASQEDLQEQVVDQIVSLNRPYLQMLVVPEETTNRRIDVLATIEALLRKFCTDFLKLLFNNGARDFFKYLLNISVPDFKRYMPNCWRFSIAVCP